MLLGFLKFFRCKNTLCLWRKFIYFLLFITKNTFFKASLVWKLYQHSLAVRQKKIIKCLDKVLPLLSEFIKEIGNSWTNEHLFRNPFLLFPSFFTKFSEKKISRWHFIFDKVISFLESFHRMDSIPICR